jgi:hypothetical protein
MKTLVSVIHALLLSSTFLIAETGKLEKSPIDGLIEITCQAAKGDNDRHFINASQVVRVFTEAESVKENGDRNATAVVITTSAVEIGSKSNDTGARSIQYYLKYDTPQEAAEAVNQILAELRSAAFAR